MNPLILFLFMSNFAIYAYSNTYFFLAPYLESQGMSASGAGLAVSVFYAATTLARPFGGWIVERSGVRRTMILSSLGCAALSIAFAFHGKDLVPILGVRILMGLFFSVFTTCEIWSICPPL